MKRAMPRNQALILRTLTGGRAWAGIEIAAAELGLSRSSTYAALHALERDGYVTSHWDTSTSHPRRIFTITAAGCDALRSAERALGSIEARQHYGDLDVPGVGLVDVFYRVKSG